MKTLYHGTISVFDEIDTSKGEGFKDFGRGFYATAKKEHARSMAIRKQKVFNSRQEALAKTVKGYKKIRANAYVYTMEYTENVEGLNIKIFQKADLEWVKFIIENRKSKYTKHNYDIVIGPTADENTTTIINSYMSELLRTNFKEELLLKLLDELHPEKLPRQYFFANQKATKTLKFVKNKKETVG